MHMHKFSSVPYVVQVALAISGVSCTAGSMSSQVYIADLPERQYVGLTGIGLAKRLRNLKDRPVVWLAGKHGLDELDKLKPLSTKVDVKAGLALEAACTAIRWAQQPSSVRGGPWCRTKLALPDRQELRLLSEALSGRTTAYAKIEAVRSVAAELPAGGSLNMHLKNRCFNCKGLFQKCSCRLFRRQDAGLVLSKPRASGKHKSRVGAMKSGHSGKHKSRVGAMKSGRSGKHKSRVGAMKGGRSGASGCRRAPPVA